MQLAYQNALELAQKRGDTITENQRGRMREIYRKAFAQAVEEAEAKDWLQEKPILKKCIVNLGQKIGNRYAGMFDYERAHFVRKWLWVAARDSQLTWLGWIAEGLVEDGLITRGYAASMESEHSEGSLFCAVIMKFSEVAYVNAIKQSEKFKDECDCNLHYTISSVWFNEADALMESGNKDGALDKMSEAFVAFNQGIHHESVEMAKSSLQRKAATGRHSGTYKLEEKIINYWRENIGANVSNELAAEQLQKQFPEVSHRTLTSYVSKAKKLPPDWVAGTCPFWSSNE